MPRDAARGILIKDKKVLLIYRDKHGDIYYSIPGGKFEPGETPEQALIREFLEETSLEIHPITLLGTFKHPSKEKLQYIYICESISEDIKLGISPEAQKMEKDPGNIYEPKWVPIEDIAGLRIYPPYAESAVKDYVQNYMNKNV